MNGVQEDLVLSGILKAKYKNSTINHTFVYKHYMCYRLHSIRLALVFVMYLKHYNVFL